MVQLMIRRQFPVNALRLYRNANVRINIPRYKFVGNKTTEHQTSNRTNKKAQFKIYFQLNCLTANAHRYTRLINVYNARAAGSSMPNILTHFFPAPQFNVNS